MHIGSGPGVAGLSGMQVKAFVPLRSVRIVPFASMATMVAPPATLAGAAVIALAIICAFVGAAFGPWAHAAVVSTSSEPATSKPIAIYLARIGIRLLNVLALALVLQPCVDTRPGQQDRDGR